MAKTDCVGPLSDSTGGGGVRDYIIFFGTVRRPPVLAARSVSGRHPKTFTIAAITTSRLLRQFDINVGNVILANMPRVAPPNTYSRRREWP
jgi:hypothetical protein